MKQRKYLAVMAVGALLLSGCSMAKAVVPGVEASASVSRTQTASRRQEMPVLTTEKAQAIALAYLGLQENQITGLKTEVEEENGVLRYDVQFRHGRWEYEFQINAQTGQILSSERDD